MLKKQQLDVLKNCSNMSCIQCRPLFTDSSEYCAVLLVNSHLELFDKFAEVTEALRMILHDGIPGSYDKAEEIMCKAYNVMIDNKIEPPKFFKEA